MPRRLYKSVIVIWSANDPATMELSHLAREAEQGDAYCSRNVAIQIPDPTADPDWDGTEFFNTPEDTEDEAADDASLHEFTQPNAERVAKEQSAESGIPQHVFSNRKGEFLVTDTPSLYPDEKMVCSFQPNGERTAY